MEVFQKLKAKLAEEPDSESDREPPGASGPRGTRRDPAGGGGGRAEELEREVQELKEHINKNYFVYVKRLEKRKERIKELEEYAKLLIKDNEVLQEKQKDFEGKSNLGFFSGFKTLRCLNSFPFFLLQNARNNCQNTGTI